MRAERRRALAFVAGGLVGKSQGSSVYDYEAGAYFNFTGTLSKTNVNVFDYSRSCYVTGSGDGTGNMTLFDYCTSSYVQLRLDGSGFNGFDYETASYYSGIVAGRTITIYDYQTGSYYQFTT